MSHRKAIIEAAARAAFEHAWEEYAEHERPRSLVPGEKAPSTPAFAKRWATKLIATMERMNHLPIDKIYAHVAQTPYRNKKPTARDFGRQVAMGSLNILLAPGMKGLDGYRIPHARLTCSSDTSCKGNVESEHAQGWSEV